ncbi:hypothetical protein [Nocardiopsis alba]
MVRHLTDIRRWPVPGWTLFQPVCACDWAGDLVRTRALATEQITEHLEDHTPEQPMLPGFTP